MRVICFLWTIRLWCCWGGSRGGATVMIRGLEQLSYEERLDCGSGQPGLVVGDPAHSRGLELDDL